MKMCLGRFRYNFKLLVPTKIDAHEYQPWAFFFYITTYFLPILSGGELEMIVLLL